MRKMKMKYNWLIILLLAIFAVPAANAQNPKKFVRKGNKLFEEKKYQDAEVEYRKALSIKNDYEKAKFNLGDAMYQQKNMEESAKIFKELAETAKTPDMKSRAWYNLGNSLMNQKKYKEAMQAYKNSLLLNPQDKNAKYNYEYARKKLKQQQKQQQKKKQNQKNKNQKDKNKKDQNKNKQNQDQKKKQDKDKQDKNKQNKDNKDKNKQNKQQNQDQNQNGDQKKQNSGQRPKPQQISKKDAQRMLDALKNDEKKTLQKLQKKKAKAVKAKKSDIDW